MAGPIVSLIRHFALKKHASKTSLTILPLSSIRKATVFMDGVVESTVQDIGAVNDFFHDKGIEVTIFVLCLQDSQMINEGSFKEHFIHKRNLNFFGRIRRNKRTPVVTGDEDLFISLLPSDCYAVRYAATCSSAPFKIGRDTRLKSIYNLIVSDPEGTEASSQTACWEEITKLLTIVK